MRKLPHIFQAHVLRDKYVDVYSTVRFNARNFHRRYFYRPPPIPTATLVTDPNLRVALEAKREVEMLRESMESMFQDFGDMLQSALQKDSNSTNYTTPGKEGKGTRATRATQATSPVQSSEETKELATVSLSIY